jgi:hypothetical protein
MQDEDIAQYFEKAYTFMHDAIVGRGGKVPPHTSDYNRMSHTSDYNGIS